MGSKRLTPTRVGKMASKYLLLLLTAILSVLVTLHLSQFVHLIWGINSSFSIGLRCGYCRAIRACRQSVLSTNFSPCELILVITVSKQLTFVFDFRCVLKIENYNCPL